MSFLVPIEELEEQKDCYLVSEIRDPHSRALYAKSGLKLDSKLIKTLKRQQKNNGYFPPLVITLDPTECTLEERIKYNFMVEYHEMASTLAGDIRDMQKKVAVRENDKVEAKLKLHVYKRCLTSLFDQLSTSSGSPILRQLLSLQPDAFSFSASVCSFGMTLALACRDLLEQWMRQKTAPRQRLASREGDVVSRWEYDEPRTLSHLGMTLLFADIALVSPEFSSKAGRHIVKKSRHGEPLTPEEEALWITHPDVGSKLLRQQEVPAPVCHAVRFSHIAFGGTGFPEDILDELIDEERRRRALHQHQTSTRRKSSSDDSLEDPAESSAGDLPSVAGEDEVPFNGNQVHIYARILRIANDAVEQMSYQDKMPIEVLHSMVVDAGKVYDPEIVKRLVRVFPPFPMGEEVDMEIVVNMKPKKVKAVIYDLNPEAPCRPWVSYKKSEEESVTINLGDHPDDKIRIVGFRGKDITAFLF